MDNFIFSTVADIEFGEGSSSLLGDRISSMGLRNAFIVSDPGILSLGLMDQALADLVKHKVEYRKKSVFFADFFRFLRTLLRTLENSCGLCSFFLRHFGSKSSIQ